MNIKQLEYFIALAEELHFGRAAERLGMAQPPLGRQIKQIEDDLGALLFNRGRNAITMTQAGERLYARGTAIAAISGEALSRLWGQQFNAQHEKAMALFADGTHTFNEPSPELMAAITAVSDTMTAEWIDAAKAAGVADPAAMRAAYLAAYAALSAP